MARAGLATLPPELLEHVALFAWDTTSPTPHADIASLTLVARTFAQQLRPSSNPLLHARLFRATFDCAALERRLPASCLAPDHVARELRRRYGAMGRFRRACATEADLWIVLLMLFEHDARNLPLLHAIARVALHARQMLDALTVPFRERARDVNAPIDWPTCPPKVNLLIWILWLTADELDKRPGPHGQLVLRIVSPYCLSGFRYALSRVEWTKFTHDLPSCDDLPSTSLTYFGAPLRLLEPDFIPGATLNFMLRLQTSLPVLPPPRPGCWDTEWDRATAVDHRPVARPGVFNGVWEGSFLFMEFQSYLQLIHGADPRTLDRAHVGQHPQVWKLREYVLYNNSSSSASASASSVSVSVSVSVSAEPEPEPVGEPVPDGDPLNGHLPRAARVVERLAEGVVEVVLPDGRRWNYVAYDDEREKERGVRDIIVVGEGHSSWGSFVLRGRVRPFDGLITLVKQYAHRGLWLYRGFVVGGRDGHFVGRWRDTETDVDRNGYEGCFVLGRRRG